MNKDRICENCKFREENYCKRFPLVKINILSGKFSNGCIEFAKKKEVKRNGFLGFIKKIVSKK